MAFSPADSQIFSALFSDPELATIFSDEQFVRRLLHVESAWARVQGNLGIIPRAAADTISSACETLGVDVVRLQAGTRQDGFPIVELVRQIQAHAGPAAAPYVHWGATTQNIFDTAASLQMFRSHAVLAGHLDNAINAFCRMAREHHATVQAGRTHGQHALPMTFGFKVAGWIDELDRDRTRLHERLAPSFVASLGGAIGTFAAMGNKGREVEARMAAHLGLLPAGLPMRSSYDRVSDYVSGLGLLAGTAQKIAQDVVFMQRTEIGEVEEAFHMGKVGSSTMAQKRNPALALMLVSLTRMLRARVPLALEAMVRMDEGDSSASNVTDSLLPEIAVIAASIAETLATLASGLVVHPEAMRRNLELTNGLIASEAAMMRLTALMGRHEAHHLLYEAAQRSVAEKLPFMVAIREHPMLATRLRSSLMRESGNCSSEVSEEYPVPKSSSAIPNPCDCNTRSAAMVVGPVCSSDSVNSSSMHFAGNRCSSNRARIWSTKR